MAQRLNFLTYQFNPLDGYGLYGIETVKALIQLGAAVTPLQFNSVFNDWRFMPDELKPYQPYDWSRLTIQLLPADAFRRYQGRQWGYTMWEDDSIPRDWPALIQSTVERLIAPCEFYAQVFHDAGVKVPIHVIPGGVNPHTDMVLPDRSGTRPFTFLVLGDRGLRKGLEPVLNALRTPYWWGKDIRLIIKTRPGAGGNDFRIVRMVEPRAEFWEEDVPSMAQVFAEADCYLYPSYGDGWGMTPRRAIMHGVPTIAPRHTGVQVGIDHWATGILETFSRPFSNYAHDQAKWFKPDVEELAESMRWVYESYQDARQQALQGRAWLSTHQPWECTARGILNLMEQYA